jgi:excinuclease ABC subunit B
LRRGSPNFERQGKLLEAQRLRMRTAYDIEMMRTVGFCSGIENYSRHIDGREAGSAPNCLLDYFPEDFLLVIDESHQTVPQIGAMYEGDMSRKRMLVDHGFRLPSADGQPAAEVGGVPRTDRPDGLPVGDTPDYEMAKSGRVRPAGRADHPPDRADRPGDRPQADQGSDRRPHPRDQGPGRPRRAGARHDVDQEDGRGPHRLPARQGDPGALPALRGRHPARVELLRELRLGDYDVLVGINLLREGLDLPEVSLVSILDADKEGFLRSTRSLIQTIGRAARHVSGQVHMYADKLTPSMRDAIDETNRRRAKQVAYNTERGLDPQPLRKKIADITDLLGRESADTEELLGSGRSRSRGKASGMPPGRDRAGRGAVLADAGVASGVRAEGLPTSDLAGLIQELTAQMHTAAAELHFELAARLRDEVSELKKELRQMSEALR